MSTQAGAPHTPPTPERFFNAMNAYQNGAALKAAIELGFFTAIAEGNNTVEKLAARCKATGAGGRGIRILADHLTMLGFLTKSGNTYALGEDAALFLDKNSPAYLGNAVEFLHSPALKDNFDHLADRVRDGGAPRVENVLSPNNEVWVKFARGMAGLMMMPSQMLAKHVLANPAFAAPKAIRVLDIAAGHGLFGIAFAQQNPQAKVAGLDWANVLEVAKEHAKKFGVADRYSTVEGSAFDVDLGKDYDLVLIPNFFHHFDAATNVQLLKKIHAALKPGGQAVTLEFAPDDSRISPPGMAGFALVMLAGTPGGDAYTVTELKKMYGDAGFKNTLWAELPMGMQRIISGEK